jgi:hypothetical protein
MATTSEIIAVDNRATTDATPIQLGFFGILEMSSALVSGKVMALRSSDGATKAWSFETCIKRGVNNIIICETIPVPVNTFASAADDTALTGVTIAPFQSGFELGVQCTGQAGQTIEWMVEFRGRSLNT